MNAFLKNSPLNQPVINLLGVGAALAGKLNDLGVYRIFDLLMHFPRDYEDKSHIIPIANVVDGVSCLVSGVITEVKKGSSGFSAYLTDNSATLELKFFHTSSKTRETLTTGAYITAFGEIKINQYGTQIIHPEYFITGTQKLNEGLVPIYPAVKGLNQNKIRQLVSLALSAASGGNFVHLDDEVLTRANLPLTGDLLQALYTIHFPKPLANIQEQMLMINALKSKQHLAYQRVIIEELTAHQLAFLSQRKQLQHHQAPICSKKSLLADALIDGLPFALTDAQKRVIDEVVLDISCHKPMLRLVQGDVGAGKTLVAAICACHALDAGLQVALMAPTEILAEQHLLNFKQWFEPFGVGVGCLLGKQSAKERQMQLDAINQKHVQIIIGTHALFSDEVNFANLGLVIIDEQHRFGVEQRLKLMNKAADEIIPHQLAMTATPIPRTLAMSLYGDMDVSVIDELPANRTPITTAIINRDRRDEVIKRVQVNCKQGKQAYWVCPLIEESTGRDIQSAELLYQELQSRLDILVGLVHGKMKAAEKQAVMQAFKQGDISLLVATTVIEVGVDVPNASLMIIENAERLGLSQLHQLRGRVGRGAVQSFCVLLAQIPLPVVSMQRLNILKENLDGFIIAQKDLQLRGAGELLGKKQTGEMNYYAADLVRDELLFNQAKTIAEHLIHQSDKQTLITAMLNLWLPENKSYSHA